MARLASQQIAGYYPTPSRLFPHLASLLEWERPEPGQKPYLLDPCAGDGEAIEALQKLWYGSYLTEEALELESWRRPGSPKIVACELEGSRAQALIRRIGTGRHSRFHGDAFCLSSSQRVPEATVLYLNPPYAYDPDFGRLEHRFLDRFTQHLAPGAGWLLFVIPIGTLASCAELLTREYAEVRAWRFPEPEWEAFRQIVVLARRSARPLTNPALETQLREAAADAERLPILEERCSEPGTVRFRNPVGGQPIGYNLAYTLEVVDPAVIRHSFRLFDDSALGTQHGVRELLGARFETAVPPRPAHIALALASGMFNGHRLRADDPARHPPLLAKGTFFREPVKVSEKTDAEGNVTTTEVEQPRLEVTILRTDTHEFHTLEAGTQPQGGDDPARWNAADLLTHYSRALTELLARQFPAVHDPRDESQRLHLPQLARKPFAAQAEAIMAGLKLLAQGKNPFLVAEVGTGKSTMSLILAAALSPEFHAATAEQLRALGFDGPLPVVRKTLILCPPHLLKSWEDQAAAVMPEARVILVREISDLEREGEIYVLSRETAKLGHAWEGVRDRCPGCGGELTAKPKRNASRRLRCRWEQRRPRNEFARLVRQLATILAPSCPAHSLVSTRCSAPALRRRLENSPARPLSRRVLRSFVQTFVSFLEQVARDNAELRRGHGILLYPLVHFAGTLYRAAGADSELLERLRRLQPTSTGDNQGAGAALARLLHELDENPPSQPAGDALAPDSAEVRSLLRVLEALDERAQWTEAEECGEPLFQAVPKPRRVPLARIIQRRYPKLFQLLVLDEAHEYNNGGSAQSIAAHRLSGLPGMRTVVLTGSLMGGYASSLFTNLWHLSPDFRATFGRDQKTIFQERYGYQKYRVSETDKSSGGPVERGVVTDREVQRRRVGEAPGVLPTLLFDHLLGTSILVHKGDLDVELPALSEEPIALGINTSNAHDRKLLAEYERLESKLLTRIKADRFQPRRAGRLLGDLVELPSYLDRATGDLGPYEVRYPEALGGGLIAAAHPLPATYTTPKERWLLAEVQKRLAGGEKVLIFLRHTGTPELSRRLLRLLEQVARRPVWLDTKKVPTAKREAWIDRHVLAETKNQPPADVLLVNPNAVRTGLNNLVSFSTGIWYELDYSATTYRQANGRLHRIGQTRDVTILYPYYAGTAQAVAFELLAGKVSASLQVDGVDVQAALEAAGASDSEQAANGFAMSLGEAVYQALTGPGRASEPKRPVVQAAEVGVEAQRAVPAAVRGPVGSTAGAVQLGLW